MVYAEALPPQCPPAEAVDTPHAAIYRLIPAKTVTADCFKSHAALGKPGGPDPCKNASCSLLRDPRRWLKAWPKLKKFNGFAAKMSIPEGSGQSLADKNQNHVHFWPYASFNCVSAVTEVIAVEELEASG